MDKLVRLIIENAASGKMDKKVAGMLLQGLKDEGIGSGPSRDIAIIGMSALLPSAKDVDGFWDNIVSRQDCITRFPESRRQDIDRYLAHTGFDPGAIRYSDGSFLEEIDKFDYKLFRLPPREASLMDPFQRLFLQTAWGALEDAGYGGSSASGSRTGVYLGFASNIKDSYLRMIQDIDISLMPDAAVGNITAMMPARISYLLDLKGPSLVVDTACSSSLVAVHLACQSLLAGDCDMALAGGLRINLLPLDTEYYRGGLEASDGRTKPFDYDSDGSGISEGVSAVLLKPLSKALRDGDNIHAVIKGSAINQDGASIGITAPNPEAQADVIARAWDSAGIHPETISFIEAHGTGTRLGDPLELEGLELAFRRYTDKKQFCPIGTVKSNIGHPFEAAGIISIIKASLVAKRGIIPPTLHFHRPSAQTDFQESPIYINTRLRRRSENGVPFRGAVSSFGFSGTNCHIVLEEPPVRASEPRNSSPRLLTLSARSEEALTQIVHDFAAFLGSKGAASDLREVCFTASAGRGHYAYRLAVIANSTAELQERLETLSRLSGPDEWRGTEAWLQYGRHKIVPSNKAHMEEGDLTEYVRNELSAEASTILQSREPLADRDDALLLRIARLYAAGADINWPLLYKGERPLRISLPQYSFESHRCWLDVPEKAPSTDVAERDGFYTMEWRAIGEPDEAGAPLSGKLLLIKDSDGTVGNPLAALLKSGGTSVVEVSPGEGYASVGQDAYTVGDSEDDYRRLAMELVTRDIDHIIHLGGIGPRGRVDTLEGLRDAQRRGVFSLYYLIRALAHEGWERRLSITLVSAYAYEVTGDEPRLQPEGAPFLSIGKVLKREFEHHSFHSVDLDLDGERPVEELLQELRLSNSTDYMAAYRDGVRYVEQFTAIDPESCGRSGLETREGGVYLITGGIGGIGLEVARYLASARPVKLVLIGRTPMPERSRWEAIAAEESGGKRARRIAVIRELEAAGASVEMHAADVSDFGAMADIVGSVRSRHGRIDGVIHGAGIGSDELLINRSESRFDEVLRAKIDGAWILDRLTADDELDMFVMFSSVATMFSAVTQGDYVAANAYLDAFAEERRKRGKPATTINWTTWKETGMSVDAGFTADTIFKAIRTGEAIDGLRVVLGSTIARVLVGTLNVDGGGLRLLERMAVRLSPGLEARIARYKEAAGTKTRSQRPVGAAGCAAVRLSGKLEGEFTETERVVAGVCQEVLGFDEIDVYENFFELGADSILLMKIHARLDKLQPDALGITDLFEYSTIAKLSAYLHERTDGAAADKPAARAVQTAAAGSDIDGDSDIAIIGMALNVASISGLDEFWESMRGRVDHIRTFPDGRKADMDRYLRQSPLPLPELGYKPGAYLDAIDAFDYSFFRMSPKEAGLTDPNQRLFLETVWRAIDDAGYGGKVLAGSDTGVFLGFSTNVVDLYSRFIYETELTTLTEAIVGNTPSMIPARISYLLDLKGPSMLVDTACSSSLVAVHLATQAIRAGECTMAAAGGIKISTMPITKKNENMLQGLESDDGKTRAFDDSAGGAGIGEGVGVVILKSLKRALKDGDNVYAIVKGSATNQDGSSVGITAPNPAAQEDVIVKAWTNAGIDPETIAYIETHGTGTELGDPIEIKGIQNAFRQFTDRYQFCAVGAAKTNFGHISEGAGMVGLIKAVLAMKHGEIPPNLHFQRPNRNIDFKDSPVYVNTRLRKWERGSTPRRCGVSAFGISGTNCHLVLEEAPTRPSVVETESGPQLLVLSARSRLALRRLAESYREHLVRHPELPLRDVCYTAAVGRAHYGYRLGILASSTEELAGRLAAACAEVKGAPWMFRGEHRIVSRSKANRELGDVTEEERQALHRRADAVLAEPAGEETLTVIARLYVQGADPAWETLYAASPARRTSLPSYPFERKRCWLDMPEPAPKAPAREEPLHYAAQWVEEPAELQQVNPFAGAVLVLGGADGMGSELVALLRGTGCETFEVARGECFADLGGGRYAVGGDQAEYEQLLAELKDKPLSRIVYMSALDCERESGSLEGLVNRLDLGVYDLFRLIKAISAVNLRHPMELDIVVRQGSSVTGTETWIDPDHAPLAGLGKTIGYEFLQLTSRCLDIDDSTGAGALVDALTVDNGLYMTALRGGRRYVQQLGELPIETLADRPTDIREDSCYVITGGVGGIGLEVAKRLAARNRVKLALVNRSPFPDRSQWDDVLNDSNDARLRGKIRALQAIEAGGSEVSLYSSDIANPLQVEAMLTELRGKYGAIRGIVHAAGVAGEGFLVNKTESEFARVMSPKVQGTYVLDHATRGDKLDFFVLFSTATTLFSEPGQGDYTAANAYLDAYAAHRGASGRRTLTINWVAWKETGMAKDFGANHDAGFKALTTEQGLSGMERALAKEVRQAVVGRLNREDIYQYLSDDMPNMLFSDDIADAIAAGRDRAGTAPGADCGETAVMGRADGRYSDTERAVAAQWCQHLGVKEIGIFDDFYEWGGDSIVGLRIANGLYKSLGRLVNTAEVLAHPTIADFAAYFDAAYGEGADGGTESAEPQLTPLEERDYYPVSSGQKRFLLLHHLEGDNTSYNIPRASIMEGEFDVKEFEDVLRTLIRRHESLRTSFELLDGIPYQKIWKNVDFKVGYSEAKEEELRERLQSFVRPIDLRKAPLFHFEAVKLGEKRHAVFFDMHHIITDGISMDIIMSEIIDLYEGRELPPVTVQYKDYADWHNRLLETERMKRQERYWLDVYREGVPQLRLPTDFSRPEANEYEGDIVFYEADEAQTRELESFANELGVTPYMLLLGAFNVLLHKYTAQEDIVVGSPIAGRPHPELARVVGVFINLIAIRSRVRTDATFLDVVREARRSALEAYENQDFPYEELVRKLGSHRELNRNALFDVMFALQNVGTVDVKVSKFTTTPYTFGAVESRFDLYLEAIKKNGRLRFNLEYRTKLIKRATAERMLGDYMELLRTLMGNKELRLGEIELTGTSLAGPFEMEEEDVEFQF